MDSTIKIDTKQHDAMVRRILKKYRLNTFKLIAETIDKIRFRAAVNHIIPTDPEADLNKEGMSFYKQRKIQPSHPTKLTSRSGLLVAMLKEKAKPYSRHWQFTERSYKRGGFRYTSARSAKLDTAAFKGRIKVKSGLNTNKETYLGKLSVSISSTKPSGYTKPRINLTKPENALLRENRFRWNSVKSRMETPDTIRARFRHEKGMSHCPPRKFIGPAIDETETNFRTLIQNKINEIQRYR